MPSSDVYHLNCTCLNCRHINQLVTNNLLDDSVVSCSHCHAPLGALYELGENQENHAGNAATARRDGEPLPADGAREATGDFKECG